MWHHGLTIIPANLLWSTGVVCSYLALSVALPGREEWAFGFVSFLAVAGLFILERIVCARRASRLPVRPPAEDTAYPDIPSPHPNPTRVGRVATGAVSDSWLLATALAVTVLWMKFILAYAAYGLLIVSTAAVPFSLVAVTTNPPLGLHIGLALLPAFCTIFSLDVLANPPTSSPRAASRGVGQRT